MTFLNDVFTAIREVAYEFQAGPQKPRAAVRRSDRFPKFPKVKLKRDLEPKRPRLKPKPKVLKKEFPPRLVKIIKRERAFIKSSPKLEEKAGWEQKIEENDTGINKKIEPACQPPRRGSKCCEFCIFFVFWMLE